MPRIAKKDMAPLPKPVIKSGSLGFFPLNGFSVSYVAQGHGTAILGHVDDPRNATYKEHPTLTLKAGRSSSQFSLVGVFFTGLADALYRGKLPQVIIATPAPSELKVFLNEFLDYVEKMITLGFTLGKSNPVEELIPCYVIASPGVFFSSFLTQLVKNLENMPNVDERMRQRIVGRFCRGFVDCDVNTDAVGKQVQLLDIPRRIKIAGGDEKTQGTVQSVLSAHEIITVIENSVRNPAERLEFENALWRTANVILPLLKEAKALTAKDAKALQGKVGETIMEIGRKRQAFEEFDNLGSLAKSKKGPGNKSMDAGSLSTGDAAILGGLRFYAELLNLGKDTQDMFETLSVKVAERLSK